MRDVAAQMLKVSHGVTVEPMPLPLEAEQLERCTADTSNGDIRARGFGA